MPEGQIHGATKLGSYIGSHRAEVLDEWRRRVRELPQARDLSPPSLVDHIPELLDEIADIADRACASAPGSDLAREHALTRLGEGFDVTTIVRELSLLRDAILRVWSDADVDVTIEDIRMLNAAIDEVIAVSAGRFSEAHERTLAAIDRISTASFEARDVGELMQRLLLVFRETTPAVETAAILLLEDGRLESRAAIGFAGELGDCDAFAATVAARREPIEVSPAGRALYGVPLIHGGELIGVAHMGSTTTSRFSHEDRHLFDSMAARATLGIAHHVLRRELAGVASEREEALTKLEALLAASPVGIAFLDRDLRYLRINEALAAMNGRPAPDHLGRTIDEILGHHAERLRPILDRVRDTGDVVRNLEIGIAGPSVESEQRTLLATYFPIRAASGEVVGIGGFVMDVTDARRAREALRVEQLRIQSILEHAPAAIWVKDHRGRIILANHRLADVFGRSFDEVVGRRSVDLLPADVAAAHEAHDRKVRDDQRAIEVEEEIPSAAGMRTFLSIKFPIPGDPPLVGGIATEITARKRIEGELREAVRTREDVLAIVSHDLRSPLQAIEMSASVMQTQLAAEPKARRPLEVVLRACRQMVGIIDDLLDSAMIRMRSLKLEIRPERVDGLVLEALDHQASVAEKRGIHLVLADVAAGQVLCDRGRILRVFANLIGNALKFCSTGDTITLAATHADHHVVFTVTDTGPGIPPETLPFIFEPYKSGEHRKRGSGLGLYIARGIVEAHGGTISVDSAPSCGARFTFTLPWTA